jgi:hypothetical protein
MRFDTVRCGGGTSIKNLLVEKSKTPMSFATEAPDFIFALSAFWFSAPYLLAVGIPVVIRNSANSVELLIFVTNQGSGPMLAVVCSWMTRPIGVGPNAIE